jgi:nucleoid DNA-binding protein
MSWSVNAKGRVSEVKVELLKEFIYPLAAPPGGLTDEGERETVKLISEMLQQCLNSMDEGRQVQIIASGHFSCDNQETRAGAYQSIEIKINPYV